MSLQSLLGLLLARGPRRRSERPSATPARRPASTRLAIEALEDRSVPSTLPLVGGGPNPPALVGVFGQLADAGHFVPHKESTDGHLTSSINPTATNPLGTQTWVAAGNATQFGSYTEVGSHNFTAPDAQGVGLILNGVFTSTAADGSTISGTYSGTYTSLADGTVEYHVTPIWVQGTGRFAGVTGQGDVIAVLNGTTGTFHFDTVATWSLP
jgi:hypothetical protein